LQPRSRWRREYADWPALKKLQYVDELMQELQTAKPSVHSREVIEPLSQNKRTLREFYRRELGRFSIESTSAYDRQLLRVFAPRKNSPRAAGATAFLRSMRPTLTRALTRDARIHAYLVHNVIRMIIDRCRELDLVVRGTQRTAKAVLPRLVEHIVFDTLYRRRQQYAL
jgi:hypothetical protein